MSSDTLRPFLINQDGEGNYRLTVRDIRYNSQGYPIVTGVMQDELFKTAAAAKSWARDNFQAKAGQYASK
ncbi:hypothetical protein [Novosphingobium sp.]|uniref:hypothetical protein n=1 Tax=Novosphingobium sp. TaxID=1874826 RepID=UPI0025EA5FAE|nr:hypothetical protein [Novosphingobium sp.]